MRITLIDAGKRFNRDWIFRHFHYQFNKGGSYAITGPNGSGKSTLLQVIGGAVAMSEGSVCYEEEAPGETAAAAAAGETAAAAMGGEEVRGAEETAVRTGKTAAEATGREDAEGGRGSGESAFGGAVLGEMTARANEAASGAGAEGLGKTVVRTDEAARMANGERKEGGRVIPVERVHKHISLAAPYLELIEEMTMIEFLDFHSVFKPFLPGLDSRAVVSLLGLEKAAGKQIRYYSSGMKQRVKLGQSLFSDTPVVLLDEPCTNLDSDGIAQYRGLIDRYGSGRTLIVSSNDRQEYDFCEETIDIMRYK